MAVYPRDAYTTPRGPACCMKAARSAGKGWGAFAVNGPTTCTFGPRGRGVDRAKWLLTKTRLEFRPDSLYEWGAMSCLHLHMNMIQSERSVSNQAQGCMQQQQQQANSCQESSCGIIGHSRGRSQFCPEQHQQLMRVAGAAAPGA